MCKVETPMKGSVDVLVVPKVRSLPGLPLLDWQQQYITLIMFFDCKCCFFRRIVSQCNSRDGSTNRATSPRDNDGFRVPSAVNKSAAWISSNQVCIITLSVDT